MGKGELLQPSRPDWPLSRPSKDKGASRGARRKRFPSTGAGAHTNAHTCFAQHTGENFQLAEAGQRVVQSSDAKCSVQRNRLPSGELVAGGAVQDSQKSEKAVAPLGIAKTVPSVASLLDLATAQSRLNPLTTRSGQITGDLRQSDPLQFHQDG